MLYSDMFTEQACFCLPTSLSLGGSHAVLVFCEIVYVQQDLGQVVSVGPASLADGAFLFLSFSTFPHAFLFSPVKKGWK